MKRYADKPTALNLQHYYVTCSRRFNARFVRRLHLIVMPKENTLKQNIIGQSIIRYFLSFIFVMKKQRSQYISQLETVAIGLL